MSDDLRRQLDRLIMQAKEQHRAAQLYESQVALARVLDDFYKAGGALIAAADAVRAISPQQPQPQPLAAVSMPHPQSAYYQTGAGHPLPHQHGYAGQAQPFFDDSTQE